MDFFFFIIINFFFSSKSEVIHIVWLYAANTIVQANAENHISM